MTFFTKNVWLVVGLIVISLTGLVALQASLLQNAKDSKESAFRSNVLAAMGSVVQALEEQEAIRAADEFARRQMAGNDTLMMSVITFDGNINLDSLDTIQPGIDKRAVEIDKSYRQDPKRPSRVYVKAETTTNGVDTIIVDTVRGPIDLPLHPGRSGSAHSTWIFQIQGDSSSKSFCRDSIRDTAVAGTGRVDLVRKIVSNLTVGEQRPIGERLQSDQLDSLLSHYLQDAGVDLDYAFGVLPWIGDTLAIAQPAVYSQALQNSDLKVQLFPNDVFADPADLALFFPERGSYLWLQMGPMLAATSLLMAIIIFCFVYSIRTIAVQRRNARLMVDFVNNMTHEFKTPISTVALACEAILRPDVLKDQSRVSEFSHMIQSENKRMRKQTEKILQMAALEDKDYELSLSEVNAHEVIQAAVDTIALQVESRQGKITCQLEAVNPTITADKVHLEAIIHNLLDNANKYSPETPEITVRTRNAAQGLIVEIEDEGIGLREEDLKRVFEKYFRVPSGDRHDVKGFGLGLSYVDLIMKAHRGRVSLESKYGQGTLVRLVFPVGTGEG